MRRLSKFIKIVIKVLIVIFAIWGFVLTVIFFAMKFGLTKSKGYIDNQSQYFKKLLNNAENGNDERSNIAVKDFEYIKNLEEWKVISLGIEKDKNIIERVAKETNINARLIITPLVAEQLRLMTSEREIFKRYFQPLAVLGTQTQFSLGIYGIKEATAKEIERNLKNPNSQYYLGEKYSHLLDYSTNSESLLVDAFTLEVVKDNKISSTANTIYTNISTSTNTEYKDTILLNGNDAERVRRLTNEKDHYYSYLYAAIYLKQIETAWKNAGFSISDRPEIIATLYNIGFNNSHPNIDPKVGGAEINLYGKKYSFGAIAFYFYFSDELSMFLK